MAKKIVDSEVKKECPSCGLGVAMDATVCEFCGWDFEEENEWILQIEKLERDLMLEKQKFEPGTVNQKIESTLHAPALERVERVKAEPTVEEEPPSKEQTRSLKASPFRTEPKPSVRQAKPAEIASQPAAATKPAEAPTGKVRRVRKVKGGPDDEEAGQDETKKVRTVRKMKS